ncbi:hypothetical protein HYX14_05615 [Candidatus Woesearchaeota archaeon]|nr:hypothetical protein [Candidatus Woesearchaeota archaeon]
MVKNNLLVALVVFSFILMSGCARESLEKIEPTKQISLPLSADERQQQSEPSNGSEISLPEALSKGMAFEVIIPENTPEGDTIWIYVMQIPHKMEQIKDFTYTITLNETQLFDQGYSPIGGDTIRYRYSRNRYDFHTAEYLEPTREEPDRDTNNYFWTKHGRQASYEPTKIQKDIIERWRWFPKEGMITKTTNEEPSGQFLPRVNNRPFRSGQTIEDLYVPAFHDFFDSTAKHLKEQGYTWVEIDPPWQWVEENGLPKAFNDLKNNPNYPDDETFLEEVKAYRDRGLKVLIAPQLCCNPIDTKEKNKEWWDAYFSETERFLLHFASLAQQADADAFMYAIGSLETDDSTVNINEKWLDILKNIKKEFKGEIGEMVWILGPEVSPEPQPIPNLEYITWADQLDFILVATEFPLSEKDNPADEKLEKRAGEVLDGMKIFYDEFGLPIMIRNGYFNVKYSWKGQSFYHINSVPWIGDQESKLKESVYEFNTEDHARVVNVYFKAIAERPWVIGYFHFGYTHWEDPLSPWMSIRGKPAEDIWRKWNGVIYEE